MLHKKPEAVGQPEAVHHAKAESSEILVRVLLNGVGPAVFKGSIEKRRGDIVDAKVIWSDGTTKSVTDLHLVEWDSQESGWWFPKK